MVCIGGESVAAETSDLGVAFPPLVRVFWVRGITWWRWVSTGLSFMDIEVVVCEGFETRHDQVHLWGLRLVVLVSALEP